jgi:glycosyltransferase involved in cell wall biosynthesis
VKLTVITNETPFPAIHGGRVDGWLRMQAFAAEGVKMQLVFWHGEKDRPDKPTLDTLHSLCESVLAYPISSSWTARLGYLTKLGSQSLYVSSRELPPGDQKALENEFSNFSPDAIWLDAVFGGKLALGLADRFQKPLFYRSQNIEFQYRQTQYERALGLRATLATWMAKRQVETLELSLMNRASGVWDISLDDLEYWRSRGVEGIEWLPPFADPKLIDELRSIRDEPAFDLVYLGNLYTPNNIEGVSWFLREAWPRIRSLRADARFLLAGVDPHPKIQRLSQTEGVTLLANAPSVAGTYGKGRVLINPILAGSGVNVKSVEMLFSGKPVVTCPQGVAGLPPEIQAYFSVANTPEEFAEACLDALRRPAEERANRDLSAFTFEAIKPVIARMRSLIAN